MSRDKPKNMAELLASRDVTVATFWQEWLRGGFKTLEEMLVALVCHMHAEKQQLLSDLMGKLEREPVVIDMRCTECGKLTRYTQKEAGK